MGNELPKEHLTQADADIINATSWEDLHPEWIDDGDLTRHFSKTQFADCPACGKFEQLEVMNTTYDDPGAMVFCRPCQFGASGETPSEAIENWNRRAEPTRPDATAALVKARDVLQRLENKCGAGHVCCSMTTQIVREALPEIEAAIGQEVKENG